MAHITVDTMAQVARTMLGMEKIKVNDDKDFRSFFGAPIPIIQMLWNKIVDHGALAKNGEPKHLLWALLLLKTYAPMGVLRRICGWPSENQFREFA